MRKAQIPVWIFFLALAGFLFSSAQAGDRPFIGLAMQEISERLALAKDLGTQKGVFVLNARPGFAAAGAGLQNGDIITSINGKRVNTPDEVSAAVVSTGVGGKMACSYIRDGKAATVNITPGKPPEPTRTEQALALLGSQKNEAVSKLKKLASDGEPEAMYALGRLYSQKQPVGEDKKAALEYYCAAAEKGYAPAQHALGYSYLRGSLGTKDVNIAAKWLEKAALQDYAGAMVMLAYTVENDKDYTGDRASAFKWYEKAALQGLSDAQYSAAVACALGRGLKKDQVEALKWYILARKSPEPQDDKLRDNIEKVLKILKTTMKKPQVEEAEKRAARFWPELNYHDYTFDVMAINDILSKFADGDE